MDSSTVTEEFDPAHTSASFEDAPTEIQRRPPIPAIPSSRERCAACGAALAPDQRYCVECGQRRGGARPPFVEQPAVHMGTVSTGPSRSPRPLMSINATLLAGIGTLLLAMGIGILIGRSGQGSSTKAPAVQFLTVPGTAGSAATGASGSAASSEAAGVSTTTTGAAAAKPSSPTSTPKPAPKKSRPPAPKTVTVGSKGSGPGYQKGKFTGNFFGEGEK